ncbi:MAG: hypothetical protein HXX14_09210, partial [Bacteroidetes bacterium]|nr:hypothetical protein [Bacteroidota bacterium]
MAHLVGPIQFTGSVGNVRSYYDKKLKRYILSTKGGATKELIHNSPAFERTRENMSEFAACSEWASLLRKSFTALIHLIQGSYFSAIVSASKAIQKYDTEHDKGSRSIMLSKAPGLVVGLDFNSYHPFDQVLTHQFTIGFSNDRTTVTLALHDFIPHVHLRWPNRIQAYRFALGIAQIPDYVMKPGERYYEPTVKNLLQRSVCSYTDWYPDSTLLKDIMLSASFVEQALSASGTTVVVAVGIEILAQSSTPGYSGSESA